jgi:hypothetical protein
MAGALRSGWDATADHAEVQMKYAIRALLALAGGAFVGAAMWNRARDLFARARSIPLSPQAGSIDPCV